MYKRQDTGFCPGNTVLTLRNINTTAVEKYIWNTGDTSATIQVRNAGQYSVTAQNWQCRVSDSITISKACYLDIPNGFNPGSGSDYDSYFLPRDLLSKSVVTFEMEIYDRWGQQLFMSDKLNGRGSVSYTHLDVYKRQTKVGLGRYGRDFVCSSNYGS